MSTRQPAVAGTFYPGDATELKNLISEFLAAAKLRIAGKVMGLISPHAGYIYSGPIAAFGYKAIPKTTKEIILIGPSHHAYFSGLALSDFTSWQTPLGQVAASSSYKGLLSNANFKLSNDAHIPEHSLEVELPFLQEVLGEFEILPIVTGEISEFKSIANDLAKLIDKDTVIAVSSDLSHYLPYDTAVKADKNAIQKILNRKSTILQEEACGADGINILIEIAKLKGWKPKLLDYRNSGDTAGEKDQVVGYASIVFIGCSS